MRLTKALREVFVDAVIADIPRIDYNEIVKARMYDDIQEFAPGPVVQLFNNPDTRHYVIGTNQFRPESSDELGWNDRLDWHVTLNEYVPSPKAKADFKIIAISHEEQVKDIKRIRLTLSGIAKSCNTSEALLKKLPEFAKYLPKDVEASTNLPAVANLSAELIRLGWPKK